MDSEVFLAAVTLKVDSESVEEEIITVTFLRCFDGVVTIAGVLDGEGGSKLHVGVDRGSRGS